MDIDRPLAPAEFAGLIGLSRQFVAELMMRSVLPRGATGREWIGAYCGHLREQAAMRSGGLVDSRSALDAARAAEIRQRNLERRRTLAPLDTIEGTVAAVAAALAGELAALPAAIVSAWPEATSEQLAFVHLDLARAESLARAAKRVVEEDPTT